MERFLNEMRPTVGKEIYVAQIFFKGQSALQDDKSILRTYASVKESTCLGLENSRSRDTSGYTYLTKVPTVSMNYVN